MGMIRIKDRDEFYRTYYLYLLLHDDTTTKTLELFPTPEEQCEYFAHHYSVDYINKNRIIIPDGYIEFFNANILGRDEDYDIIRKYMINEITSYPYVFEPEKYEWEVALLIGLIPHIMFIGDNYLFLLSPGSKENPYLLLDTYQLLVDRTLPEDSPLLYTERIPELPPEIYEKVVSILSASSP